LRRNDRPQERAPLPRGRSDSLRANRLQLPPERSASARRRRGSSEQLRRRELRAVAQERVAGAARVPAIHACAAGRIVGVAAGW
jgi:hypothetical protein